MHDNQPITSDQPIETKHEDNIVPITRPHGIKARDLCVLLYGNYAEFNQAIRDIETLPAPLQKNRPYIRCFKGIQNTAS